MRGVAKPMILTSRFLRRLSPLLAMILPSRTPTSTPHPVPQNRQGALPQMMPPSASFCLKGEDADAPAAANAAAQRHPHVIQENT